ncbi:hypothetical protein [Oceanicoccus sp. KOV_DT_Chl]|uniref:hypothetical protein n=1 Tax=Oceanicoccus sp. KOV_DT_Chl TaxID=1904639 RepID=UPI000C7D58A4|nr:hypothetical protein [Oceanicoccus sp. KOV_DT_Chl]
MFILEWGHQFVRCICSGSVSGSELLRANQLIHADARFDELKFMTFNMEDVEKIDVSIPDIERVAAFGVGAARSNPNLRCAMVSTSEDLYGLSSMYQMTMEEAGGATWSMGMFATTDAAEIWLSQECV